MRKYSRISTKNARLIREMIWDARFLDDLYTTKNRERTGDAFATYWIWRATIIRNYVDRGKLDLWHRVQDRQDWYKR